MSKPRFFEESCDGIEGCSVLLDLDGTLLPDGEFDLSDGVRACVSKLKERNAVYLITNGKSASRAWQIADDLGIPIAPAGVPARKPRLSAVRGIPTDRPFVVVGDMTLTDGLLAYRLRAPFVRVSRRYPARRPVRLAFSHLIDDIVSFFI